MTKNESQQIGILIGEVEGINKRLDKFNGQIKDLANKIDGLPCEKHDAQIRFLEKVQNCNQDDKRLKSSIKGGIRAQVIGSCIAAGAGFAWALIQYFS